MQFPAPVITLSPLRKVKKPRMYEFANLTIVAYSAGCKFNKCLISQIKTFRSGLNIVGDYNKIFLSTLNKQWCFVNSEAVCRTVSIWQSHFFTIIF